jgi:hypothetical protein
MTMSNDQRSPKRHRVTVVGRGDKPKRVVKEPTKKPEPRPEKLSWQDPRTWEDVT